MFLVNYFVMPVSILSFLIHSRLNKLITESWLLLKETFPLWRDFKLISIHMSERQKMESWHFYPQLYQLLDNSILLDMRTLPATIIYNILLSPISYFRKFLDRPAGIMMNSTSKRTRIKCEGKKGRIRKDACNYHYIFIGIWYYLMRALASTGWSCYTCLCVWRTIY